jgi:hypothetical protein
MQLLPLPGHGRGIGQIGQGLGTLDREVFEAIAESLAALGPVGAGPRRGGWDGGHGGQLQRAVSSAAGVSSVTVTGRDGGIISRHATKYA